MTWGGGGRSKQEITTGVFTVLLRRLFHVINLLKYFTKRKSTFDVITETGSGDSRYNDSPNL